MLHTITWSTLTLCCSVYTYVSCFQDIVKVRLVDTHDHVLSTYDRQIAIYATEQFTRNGIELVMGCRVSNAAD